MELLGNWAKEWYARYLTEFKEQIRYQEQKAKYILDRNYDLLYDYFCNVLERKEKYKIFRARRCQVLFQFFAPIILMNEKDIRICGVFISDHAIVKYREDILNESAVILDDIVIHGRGLQETYRLLDPSYENDRINVYVHKMSRNANSLDYKLKRKVLPDSVVFDWEWRELSVQLVKIIQETATPYVSYVETYISKEGVDSQREREFFFSYNNTDEQQVKEELSSTVLFERDTVPSIISSWSYDACIRCYENKEMNKITYVPHIFAKPVSGIDIERFSDLAARNLDSEFHALKAELKMAQDDCESIKYKAYLMNALLNRIYGLHLNHKYKDLFDLTFSDFPTLSMCFGDAVACDIERLEYNDIVGLMDCDLHGEASDMHIQEDRELLDGLKETLELKDVGEDDVLSLYFCYNRQLDEESAKHNGIRKDGLTTRVFYDRNDDDIHKMSAAQLKYWDGGMAACHKVIKDNKIVYPYVRAGEQSFRYIVELMNELGKDNLDNLQQLRNAVIDGKETIKGKMIREFLEVNKSCLYEWDVPGISIRHHEGKA